MSKHNNTFQQFAQALVSALTSGIAAFYTMPIDRVGWLDGKRLTAKPSEPGVNVILWHQRTAEGKTGTLVKRSLLAKFTKGDIAKSSIMPWLADTHGESAVDGSWSRLVSMRPGVTCIPGTHQAAEGVDKEAMTRKLEKLCKDQGLKDGKKAIKGLHKSAAALVGGGDLETATLLWFLGFVIEHDRADQAAVLGPHIPKLVTVQNDKGQDVEVRDAEASFALWKLFDDVSRVARDILSDSEASTPAKSGNGSTPAADDPFSAFL